MLARGKKLRVGRARICGIGVHGKGGVDVECDGRQTEFLVAGLVAQLQRNVLWAERSVGSSSDGQAQDDFVLINVQRRFAEGEGVEFAFRIGNFARLKAGGRIRSEIRGDQILSRRLVRIDMETTADVQNNGDPEIARTCDGLS